MLLETRFSEPTIILRERERTKKKKKEKKKSSDETGIYKVMNPGLCEFNFSKFRSALSRLPRGLFWELCEK